MGVLLCLLDGHTAAMVEPYQHSDGETGLLLIPAAELAALVTALDAHGFTVKRHAAGDGAVRAGLDAIAAARAANGSTGLLHNVAHNSFVQMNDIRRARALGAVFEMSPYIWFPNPIIPDIEKAVGQERMRRWIPLRDAINAGALVVPGSDWPESSSAACSPISWSSIAIRSPSRSPRSTAFRFG